jgi:hypothetical protein
MGAGVGVAVGRSSAATVGVDVGVGVGDGVGVAVAWAASGVRGDVQAAASRKTVEISSKGQDEERIGLSPFNETAIAKVGNVLSSLSGFQRIACRRVLAEGQRARLAS